MRAKRARALRRLNPSQPNPGRKYGGTMKAEAEAVDARERQRVAIRKSLRDVFKPKKDE